MRRTVPPLAEIPGEIDRLLSRGLVDAPQSMLPELGRLGARLIVQRDPLKALVERAGARDRRTP